MSNSRTAPGPVSLEQSLAAYEQAISRFGSAPVVAPGRIQILDWDLEYVCGAALVTFIDQILVRRLNDFVPENDHPLILDCGANIGFSTLNYLRQYPKAKVVAFEPDPQFAPVLRRNLERNGAADVEVVEAAAWISKGEARWLCEGIDGSKILELGQEAADTAVVRTVDLAGYLDGPVDLLKLDIEGAEYAVLEHLGGRLGNVRNALIECHLDQSNVPRLGRILELLAAVGFKVSVNTFGLWRDLVRHAPVAPHHWEQYLLVAAWRGEPEQSVVEDALLPYTGAYTTLELRTLRAEAGQLRLTAAAAQQKLETFVISRRPVEQRTLEPPFSCDQGRCWIAAIPDLEPGADNQQDPVRSTLLLLENERLLGPAHALHDDIRTDGGGRYSHWRSDLYFSTPDNTDPNTNRRIYSIVTARQQSGNAGRGE